jgi:sialate O-acetylesterase
LPPMPAGGPYSMEIKGKNKIMLDNILVGDVWLCAGQSNMVIPMERVKEKYPEEIAAANYPEIRHFFIPTLADLQKQKDDLPSGYWKSATQQDILQFSAAAFFFAKKIYEKYHVPIGLINASVGGTPVEAWISEDGLKEFSAIAATIIKNKDTAYVNAVNRNAKASIILNAYPKSDRGMDNTLRWYDTSYIPKGWHTMNIPGYWEDEGIKDLDGIVWFRKEIDIPASMTGMPAKIFMGRIVDADYIYINGTLVGNTTYQYPPRRYTIAANILKPGKNILVIRVINSSSKGGFVPGKSYYLTAGGQSIDLKGDWQYKVGQVFLPSPPPLPNINEAVQPTALYNAMIAPLVNFPIKGILWYQGEANTSRAAEYEKLLPALIADWRRQWKEGDIPFLYAQLPNFNEVNYTPAESQWATLREGQLKTLSVPNTGMAITIDAGEWNDIHPLNKKDVGERLALAALKLAYGENIVYSGPIYQSAKTEGNRMIISFSNTGSGLVTKDGEELRWFAIAGADKKFAWAHAVIENDKVIVWNDAIPNPLYVRYAWADNPEDVNLYNKEGLPASPFRTGN